MAAPFTYLSFGDFYRLDLQERIRYLTVAQAMMERAKRSGQDYRLEDTPYEDAPSRQEEA